MKTSVLQLANQDGMAGMGVFFLGNPFKNNGLCACLLLLHPQEINLELPQKL